MTPLLIHLRLFSLRLRAPGAEAHHRLQRPDEGLPGQGHPPGGGEPEGGGAAGGEPVPVGAGRLHQGGDEEGGGACQGENFNPGLSGTLSLLPQIT